MPQLLLLLPLLLLQHHCQELLSLGIALGLIALRSPARYSYGRPLGQTWGGTMITGALAS